MRPVEEVVGKGMRSPVHEIQAEINERQAILDGLPVISSQTEDSESIDLSTDNQRVKLEKEIFKLNWWIAFDELESKYFNKHEFLHSEDNKQFGLQIRDVLSTWASSYQKGYESGRKFERRQRQSVGGMRKFEKKFLKSKEYCISRAAEIWKTPPILRMGKMAEKLMVEMISKSMNSPEEDAIKGWLKQAKEDGELIIPPEAQRGGRPKNK